MITRSSLKREIDVIRSIIAKLADYTEQHNEIHTDLDHYLDTLDENIRELDVKITHLQTRLESQHYDLSIQIDKLWNSISTLDTFTQEVDSKLYQLESKTEFLDHNKDAIEMWIECVRETQQLYEESRKPAESSEV